MIYAMIGMMAVLVAAVDYVRVKKNLRIVRFLFFQCGTVRSLIYFYYNCFVVFDFF